MKKYCVTFMTLIGEKYSVKCTATGIIPAVSEAVNILMEKGSSLSFLSDEIISVRKCK